MALGSLGVCEGCLSTILDCKNVLIVEFTKRSGYLRCANTFLGDHILQRNRPRRKIIGVRDQAQLSVSFVGSDCLHGCGSVIADPCLLVSLIRTP